MNCCLSWLQMLGPTAATSLLGLGALLVGGRVVLRRIFEVGQAGAGIWASAKHTADEHQLHGWRTTITVSKICVWIKSPAFRTTAKQFGG
jgi:hypothetical protein